MLKEAHIKGSKDSFERAMRTEGNTHQKAGLSLDYYTENQETIVLLMKTKDSSNLKRMCQTPLD